jgi:hypothetical protein
VIGGGFHAIWAMTLTLAELAPAVVAAAGDRLPQTP